MINLLYMMVCLYSFCGSILLMNWIWKQRMSIWMVRVVVGVNYVLIQVFFSL